MESWQQCKSKGQSRLSKYDWLRDDKDANIIWRRKDTFSTSGTAIIGQSNEKNESQLKPHILYKN